MTKFLTLSSRAAVVRAADIDTDQIIPARFLKVTDKQGVGKALFADRPDFLAAITAVPGAQILIAGNNFGCGSSREHAVWALAANGIRAVISTAFADIFRQNALKNGLLPIVVDAATYAKLDPNALFTVDLAYQTLSVEAGQGGPTVRFPIDSFSKTCLLEGLDELGYILKHEAAIANFEFRN